jgi:hypothetical protein
MFETKAGIDETAQVTRKSSGEKRRGTCPDASESLAVSNIGGSSSFRARRGRLAFEDAF